MTELYLVTCKEAAFLFFKLSRRPFDLCCPAIRVCVRHIYANLFFTILKKKVSTSCLHLS